jgi:hypothetical protein
MCINTQINMTLIMAINERKYINTQLNIQFIEVENEIKPFLTTPLNQIKDQIESITSQHSHPSMLNKGHKWEMLHIIPPKHHNTHTNTIPHTSEDGIYQRYRVDFYKIGSKQVINKVIGLIGSTS